MTTQHAHSTRPKRRATGHAVTRPHPLDFAPRHCDGGYCLHNHAGASRELPAHLVRLKRPRGL